MNRFLCCVFLFCISSVAFSQKQYFVYLQSETNQPFFVKIAEKVHSSAASGYLILSNLSDSSYIFKIGFPQNKWPEQQFLVSIKSKDRGFLLKNFGDKGWGLFDLQTLSVLMPDESSKDKATESDQGEISVFTEILSRPANDPSLIEKSVAIAKYEEKPVAVQSALVKEEVKAPEKALEVNAASKQQSTKNLDSSLAIKKEIIKKEDEAQLAVQQKKIDEPIAKNSEERKKIVEAAAVSVQTIKKEDPPVAVKNENNYKVKETKIDSAIYYKRSGITKKSESSTTEGFGLTFIDELPTGDRDTIQIVIPNPANFGSKSNDSPAGQRKFLNVTSDAKDVSLIGTSSANKKNCLSVASENDFLKLRKKMAAQRTEEGMISESKKVFKSKCFTTEQVKNLGNLFLNEAGKFQFYETAYPFNSDQDNFASLQVEFKDAYFIHRFKQMVN
ncbi:MAG: hypothetical protein E6H08_21040 [Bacteroidetes bacterium]|nr:MAG: hypothetical protein E6H08_21040 [Bacteroidota bacterium]